MIRFRIGLDRPVHARGEIVLIRRAPPPDRRLVARVPVAVHAQYFVFGVRPERPRLRFVEPLSRARRVKLVSSAPTAPVGMFRIAETGVDEKEEARRIAFHEERGLRMLRAERPLAADVPIEPGIV